jgi:hypothetical protein
VLGMRIVSQFATCEGMPRCELLVQSPACLPACLLPAVPPSLGCALCGAAGGPPAGPSQRCLQRGPVPVPPGSGRRRRNCSRGCRRQVRGGMQPLCKTLQGHACGPARLVLRGQLARPHSNCTALIAGHLYCCVAADLCRYDSLLRASWARQSALSGSVAATPPLHAAGVTLNVDRLVQVAQASARWRTPGGLAPGTDAGVQAGRQAGRLAGQCGFWAGCAG